MNTFIGVIAKVLDPDLYTIEVDIPGENERLSAFMVSIMTVIEQKQKINEYACVKEIPIDLIDFELPIIEAFRNKGYTCQSICKDTGYNISKKYIFICWDTYVHDKNEEILNNNKSK